jgi:hypothetical protein
VGVVRGLGVESTRRQVAAKEAVRLGGINTLHKSGLLAGAALRAVRYACCHYLLGTFPSPSSLKSPLFSASFSVRVRLHRLTCNGLFFSSAAPA